MILQWWSKISDYAWVLVVMTICAFLLYWQDFTSLQLMAGLLAGTVFSVAVLANRKLAIYAIILFAPISVPVYFEVLSLKLSFPSEYATFLLMIAAASLFFVNEKLDRNILFHPISIILMVDLGITAAASVFSTMPLISLKRTLLKIAFVAIYYFVFSHWFKQPKERSKLFFLYGIGFLYPIYSTLRWHSFEDFSVQASFAMCKPYFNDHTIYGACLVFILPFLISWLYSKSNRKNLYYLPVILLTCIIIVAAILSYSRAAWISVLTIFLLVAFLKAKGRIIHLIVVSGVFALILSLNFNNIVENLQTQEIEKPQNTVSSHLETVTDIQTDASNLERVNRWVCAVRMFQEKPLTGFGPGTYPDQYGQFQSVDFMTRISTNEGDKGHAHSEYLGALSETGIFGLLSFLVLVFYSLHIGIQNYYHYYSNDTKRILIFGALAGLTTFFIHGLFNGFLDYEKMAILVYGCLAILIGFDIERRKESSP